MKLYLLSVLWLSGGVVCLPVEDVLIEEGTFGDGGKLQAPDTFLLEDDPTLAIKEKKRFVRHYGYNSNMMNYLGRNVMDKSPWQEDCSPPPPYFTNSRTHGGITGPSLFGDYSALGLQGTQQPNNILGYGSSGLKLGAVGQYSNTAGIPVGGHHQTAVSGHQTAAIGEPHNHHQYTFYTTVPFISGYRLSPIYSEKKLLVKDVLPTNGLTAPQKETMHQILHLNHGQNFRTPEEEDLMANSMLNQGNEFNIIFGQPNSMSDAQLKGVDDYNRSINDLRQKIEHLQSLRQNVDNPQMETTEENIQLI